MRQTINRAANRLALTFLISAILIASSMVVLAQVPPFVGSIPLLAFIGYLFALLLSIALALSIWFRSGD